MIKDFKKATEQLKELVEVLNSIKSEAVQLKLVDFFLGYDFDVEAAPAPVVEVAANVEPVEEILQVKKGRKEKEKKEKKEKKPKKEKEVRKEEVVLPVEVVEPEVAKPKTKGRPRKEKVKTEKVKVSKKRIPNRPGPSIILNALLEDNYFTENRTIGQIVEQCDEKYHYKYKSTDLSGTLAKLAKEGVLSRSKNPDSNQFEYIKA
jgi:outer membrane biosynthesis protein TonB